MSRPISSRSHKTRTRERVMVPASHEGAWVDPNCRAERRRAKREAAKEAARTREHDPRAVRFAF